MTTHEEKAREIVQSLCFENAHFWCAECGCGEKVAAALLQAEQGGIERAAYIVQAWDVEDRDIKPREVAKRDEEIVAAIRSMGEK